MSPSSLIFFGIFGIPLVVFLVWIMRQDKRRGAVGLVVLAVAVIIAIVVAMMLYLKMSSNNQ